MFSVLAALAFSVGSVRLERLTDTSDRIVVARVEAVATFPRTQSRVQLTQWDSRSSFDIARARVVRSLKGAPEAPAVCFLATSTWTCDVSGAEEGETVLLFLVRSTRIGRAATVEPERFDAFTSKRDMYEIAWSGRGRMPIEDVDGEPRVTWWGNVTMPNPLQLHAERESPGFRAPLDELEACVGAYLAICNEPLVHAFDRWPTRPKGDWDLRVSTDGNACARYYGRGSTDLDDPARERRPSEEWVGRIGADALAEMRAHQLESRATPLPDVIGATTTDAQERILSVFAEPISAGGERVATTARLIGERGSSPDARAERAWSLWNEVERIAGELTTSLGRSSKSK